MDKHVPVLLNEAVDFLQVKAGSVYVDATLGLGGHAKEILARGGIVVGIDDDPKAIVRMGEKGIKSLNLVNGNFRDIDKILADLKIDKVDGIIADLGLNSVHYDNDDRGFSFQNLDSVLDMRLNPEKQSVKGYELLNGLRADQLAELFVKKLAEEICRVREKHNFYTVGDFVKVCEAVFRKKGKINVATKPFMFLRIAVNSEFENLKEFLKKGYEVLKPGGRLVVISFHSGEDVIVKDFFKEKKKVIDFMGPGIEEIEGNVRARSAKLRVIEK